MTREPAAADGGPRPPAAMMRILAAFALLASAHGFGFHAPALKHRGVRGSTVRPSWGLTQGPAAPRPRLAAPTARWASEGEESEEPVVDEKCEKLAARLFGTSVYFVGMMGSGKSTVGRALAKALPGYSFLDTDTVIEAYAGTDIPTIFSRDGEEAFRDLESMVMDQACAYRRLCVATGGGMVLQNQNWGKMQTGLVVYLAMEPAIIAKRLSANEEEIAKRPLLQSEDPVARLEEILEARKERYEIADITVTIESETESTEDIVSRVVSAINSFMDKNPPRFGEQNAEFMKG